MKKTLVGLALVLSTQVFASPIPIKEDVAIKNPLFSQKIYEALEAKIPAITTAQHRRSVSIVAIKGLISCRRTMVVGLNTGKLDKSFKCHLLKGGWRAMGNEMYGSGWKQELSKKFYDSLSLKVRKESGLNFKGIELDVEDGDGGTERNLLQCMIPGKSAAEMGFANSCDVLNGL